ncbi:uncharacterized protein LOC121050910 isoform X1 [Rosa chinensis]|uniref:uncharacterized protein LOC121050910 isoform X1 n=1 Tax=Rosa chinensis TaxID=74649 RepID=UPI001AD8FC41|nr:uncharacterized protein LOC121050910 isoform X1 [Rosa chinensis]
MPRRSSSLRHISSKLIIGSIPSDSEVTNLSFSSTVFLTPRIVWLALEVAVAAMLKQKLGSTSVGILCQKNLRYSRVDEEYASVRNELMLMNIRAGREDYIMNKPLPIVSVSSDEELRAEFAKRGKTFRVYIDNNRRYQKAEIHHTAKVEFGLDISLDPPN